MFRLSQVYLLGTDTTHSLARYISAFPLIREYIWEWLEKRCLLCRDTLSMGGCRQTIRRYILFLAIESLLLDNMMRYNRLSSIWFLRSWHFPQVRRLLLTFTFIACRYEDCGIFVCRKLVKSCCESVCAVVRPEIVA